MVRTFAIPGWYRHAVTPGHDLDGLRFAISHWQVPHVWCSQARCFTRLLGESFAEGWHMAPVFPAARVFGVDRAMSTGELAIALRARGVGPRA